jgi:autotransporter-associated beta strand protein
MVEFGEGSGTINFNQSDAVVFTATISGRGKVEQRGSGTTTLTGTQSYSGQTLVSSGTLLVDGNLTSSEQEIIVGENGMLGGRGGVVGAASISGTLAPGSTEQGNGIGQMSFYGNLELKEFSDVVMEIGGSGYGQYDKIYVGGAFAVSENAQLNIVLVNGYTPVLGESFTLFEGTLPLWNSGAINLPSLADGLFWDASQLGITGQLDVVPEPSFIGLFLFAALFCGSGMFRRRC